MSKIKCEVCGVDAAKGATVYRVNEKGQPGVWRCIEHFQGMPDPVVREITEILAKPPKEAGNG